MESQAEVKCAQTGKLYVMPDGRSLLALSHDAVMSMKIDGRMLAGPVKVASLSKPISIATT
jgi:hypothetical protein